MLCVVCLLVHCTVLWLGWCFGEFRCVLICFGVFWCVLMCFGVLVFFRVFSCFGVLVVFRCLLVARTSEINL